MAGFNIPGVTDQYKTNETVEKLMQVERIPLTREQNQLEEYKAQKDAWRDLNANLTSLKDSVKTLYSYENPFNNKITQSSNEDAVTAEADRNADIQSFKIDVIQPATSDRFLSGELDSDFKVPKGLYTYKVSEKQVSINWKGGSLKDFSDAVNKRGNNIVKTMIIGSSAGKKTLLIEALDTGSENRLIFEDDAKQFAIDSKMISPVQNEKTVFAKNQSEFSSVQNDFQKKNGLPSLSLSKVKVTEEETIVEPRGAFSVDVPEEIKSDDKNKITFSIKTETTTDITEELNKKELMPELPDAGFAEFEGIVIQNEMSLTTLEKQDSKPVEKVLPVSNEEFAFVILNDGTEIPLEGKFNSDENSTDFEVSLGEYKNISKIAIKNENTGKIAKISSFTAFNPENSDGFSPNNAVSVASDAIIKYEGITIKRPSNKIDDVVPEITLNIHEKTEKSATISVKPDTESSKDALINFVGKYNQTVAKINILSQNKPEIIEELEYLTDEEKETEQEKLGMFSTDFSLTSIKSSMQSIINQGYNSDENSEITMLSQIGISTNASGFSGSYSQSRLRGYLEIDEKKLDSVLENNLDEIKNIFGYDSDGDLIIDSGIAYQLDRQINAYTQTGGILAMKTSNIDSKIKTSESRIARLEEQMDDKEAQLRSTYSKMEGSLNSLESQQNTISNFTRQNNSNQ